MFKKDKKENNNIDSQLTIDNLKNIFMKSNDVLLKEVAINKNIKGTLLFIDGLVDSKSISEYIIEPLTQMPKFTESKTNIEVIKLIKEGVLTYSCQNKRSTLKDTINDILSGNAALLFEGESIAFTFDVKGFDKRNITEPTDENVIKGSRDVFVETLRVNTATIRRKIKSPNLVFEEIVLGKQTQTSISIVYMSNIVNKQLLCELKKRLNKIQVDAVLSLNSIEDYIIDKKFSAFPQVVSTERPDKFCSNVVEGRVGLIIDGIPISIIIPATFIQFIQATEDYSQNYIISSILRFMRIILIFTTLLLPGFYISIISFHHEMIPIELALSISASDKGVPFPPFLEVILLLIAFEVLMEAGLRLPKSIGQAVSIVGAIVVGQAAVDAKLVSPAVVITIAVTAMSNYTVPNQDLSNALRLWRFIIAILSSILGLMGLSIGGLILLYHLCSIECFGVPYLSPLVSGENEDFGDTLFRLPVYFLKNRPLTLNPSNKKRIG
ncbi:spore germination protein [Clostridium cochlearium]|uniref:spore germination protein n=1 Tax=Clostridium cochlearium TaxID=1494 RepID=UPI000BBBAD5F|nr:spore germination protein [Clostridium cochlearium]